MSQFINNKENIVTEAVDGLISTSGGALARLDGYPHIKVVVRNDWDKSKVALISGGGSGHEPAHAGLVGEGMLTAAVCGEVFASPSVDAVLSAILAVTGSEGCLLIIKNYTGDRLNFGLAAARAIEMGFKVNMVIVDDDIALPDLAKPRGIAGTVLVHKIAGALANDGGSLGEVTKVAENIIAGTKTIGMSLDTCTVPGSPKDQRIEDGKAELGLGIHGEPGFEKLDYIDAKQSIAAMVNKLEPLMSDEPHVVLLNNLGGVSILEMSILAHELINSSIGKKLKLIIGPASLMTAIDMRGFSISVCPLTAQQEALLKSPCALSVWPDCKEITPIAIVDLPDGLTPVSHNPSKDDETATLITQCCEIMIAAEADLNALDAKSGDGDTGSTVAGAGRSIIDALERLPLADHPKLFSAIGQELSQVMGGSSGVLLAIFFTAVGDASSNGASVIDAFKSGLNRMQAIGGANLGDRTMVDALSPALDALGNGLEAAAIAAREGANHTSTILVAKAGRSTYVNEEQLKGNIDPGAEAVARLFEGLSENR
ncbi:dihydroxyacetone kinase subunit DhaK [Cocleimonas sp. KMM 6892]|uniref:dihydroxyacetone kinase subunit DhaK n=1 Tax=unclassified Cocleimonas TaxID=2639732 RepID=UPI002DB8942E|nr:MULTISPECIES: dihydroxyacetone kinase subunit DhaK [unclassified Cocleimonas]MEB8431465.1 dihydroxyacetone kinase subunit DhaK [Cocleimonas sp. KMM 6892]MEC4713763.1 dihydroxyacetone kinase subunit DhaK [Cocleimonas sp. KMM 6895]MEC4743094.1 dihydroxyacetone kinase subunit DhaK [Cocleimonas sp. KMM 6896]